MPARFALIVRRLLTNRIASFQFPLLVAQCNSGLTGHTRACGHINIPKCSLIIVQAQVHRLVVLQSARMGIGKFLSRRLIICLAA
ncbi:hypothetical protein F5Y19DRAFT_318417 [Xylariaceae sp. FL1651]|nr:hypothetical protein F5Y19DRAFT_318417 [Xylariaceae sp. FL1651]